MVGFLGSHEIYCFEYYLLCFYIVIPESKSMVIIVLSVVFWVFVQLFCPLFSVSSMDLGRVYWLCVG